MNEQKIASEMHEYLYIATKELGAWLGKMLPRVGEDWWQECVMEWGEYIFACPRHRGKDAGKDTKIMLSISSIGLIDFHQHST